MIETRKRKLKWICIAGLTLSSAFFVCPKKGYCLFGEDVPFLIQLITQAIAQVRELQTMIGSAQETVSVLEEMNRGVKDVLRLADTAHVPLPPQVYDNARQIDAAVQAAASTYGGLSGEAPVYTRNQYRNGVEGLFLSEDAFQYSSLLDDNGRWIKDAAIVSSQATATRLSAETLGVILHAVSHESRIEAKQLEIQSTRNIEDAAKEDSRLQSFTETHQAIEDDMNSAEFSSLNAFGNSP